MIIFLLCMLCVGLLSLVVINKNDFDSDTIKTMFTINVIASCLITGLVLLNSTFSIVDVQYLHGKITDKSSQRVSCEHKYECGESCHTENGKKVCEPIYCNRHSYDIDWFLNTTVGKIEIKRINDRGDKEPPTWTNAFINEAVTKEDQYLNPLLHDLNNSIYYYHTDKEFDDLPDYPKVHSVYKFNPVVDVSKSKYIYSTISDYIINWEKENSSNKKVNIIVVLTNETDIKYFDSLMNKWKSPKKNDIILVYSIDNENNINWLEATTYAKGKDNFLLLERLKTNALEAKYNLEHIKSQLNIIENDFNKVSSERFTELKNDSFRVNFLIFAIGSIMMILLNIFMYLYERRK